MAAIGRCRRLLFELSQLQRKRKQKGGVLGAGLLLVLVQDSQVSALGVLLLLLWMICVSPSGERWKYNSQSSGVSSEPDRSSALTRGRRLTDVSAALDRRSPRLSPAFIY